MRARAREVNIFNMSLLDILCGALGAFCFMMLVLLPYYKPPSNAEDLRQEQANTDDLMQQLQKLKDSAKDSELARQLNDLVNKLQDQIKQLQGEVNRYASENQQLKEDNKNLTETNQKQSDQLEMRQPFMTLVGSHPAQALDLYLESDNTASDKKSKNPPFDLVKPHNSEYWNGDVTSWWPEHGICVWLTRDAPVGVHYKIYVKLCGDPASRQPTNVNGSLLGNGWSIPFPDMPLSPARYWGLLGTITAGKDGKATFAVATDAERDAEWTKLSKSAPPPVTAPTAAPEETSSPNISIEELEKRRQEVMRMRKLRESSPAKSP